MEQQQPAFNPPREPAAMRYIGAVGYWQRPTVPTTLRIAERMVGPTGSFQRICTIADLHKSDTSVAERWRNLNAAMRREEKRVMDSSPTRTVIWRKIQTGLRELDRM